MTPPKPSNEEQIIQLLKEIRDLLKQIAEQRD
jgi:hypothetical protein